MTYGQWHQVRIVADGCSRTQQFFVDGSLSATTAPGTLPPVDTATLFAGHLSGSSPADSLFFFDDFSLISAAFVPTAATPTATATPTSLPGPGISGVRATAITTTSAAI